MGLLDDAIREHLELKRRAGSDPEEMSRLERTAFGATAPADEPVAQAEPRVAAPEAPVAAETPPETVPASAAEPESAATPTEQPTRQFSSEELHDALRPEPQRPEAEPGPQPDEVHDELEETPEFLQETPEHDKLWFEQKPPKDFDF